MALKVRTIKLDDTTWERWQARAAVASTSVAALIVHSMEGQSPGPPSDALTQAMQQIVALKDKEIADLKDGLGSSIFLHREMLAKWMIDHHFVTGHGDTFDNLLGELADQVREMRASKQKSVPSTALPIGSPPDPTSDKPIAKVLPLTGDQFPRQLTWWEKQQQQSGQDKAKGKGK